MAKAITDFGIIPVTDEYVPKKEWEAYLAAAGDVAQVLWTEGKPLAALSLDDARKHPSFAAYQVWV